MEDYISQDAMGPRAKWVGKQSLWAGPRGVGGAGRGWKVWLGRGLGNVEHAAWRLPSVFIPIWVAIVNQN